MSFKIVVGERLIENGSLIYRDIGFGKPVSLETESYELVLPIKEAERILRADVDEFVNECKIDDAGGEVEIDSLQEAGYPSSERLATEFPQIFCKIIKEYLYLNLLDNLLKDNLRENWRYAINSLATVTVNEHDLILNGEVYAVNS